MCSAGRSKAVRIRSEAMLSIRLITGVEDHRKLLAEQGRSRQASEEIEFEVFWEQV
jgi:hypothetical protein